MTNAERLELVEDEIFNIGEAIEYLENVRQMEDVIEILKGRLIVRGFEREEYHKLVEMDDAREERALEREYYAALL
jgi:hypothetical protein